MNNIKEIANAITCHNAGKVQSILENYPELVSAKYDRERAISFLHFAVQRGSVEIIGLFLAAGADPNVQNSSGDSPLHITASLADLDKCKLLIEWGANPKLGNNSGYTPFSTALDCNNKELISYLREQFQTYSQC